MHAHVLRGKESVRVDRPVTVEIRVRGLDCSIKSEEIVKTVAEKRTCVLEDIQTATRLEDKGAYD